MTTLKEHFDLINNSTFIQNVNRGNAIDHNRKLLTEKQDYFKKITSNVGDFFKEQTASQSNFTRLK
tara:strand:+ start:4488 stop:4685 length:198 start_codon:yes stop_codon:yes gene_type:complete